jgi:transcriptional regulator GlxA family with amidase domain
MDHTGRLTLNATHTFSEIETLDVVVVPGGFADREVARDNAIVQFIKRVHPKTQWTTSVCTGSIFLAHAGVLDGLDATTHWGSYDRLAELGATPTDRRVVQVGKVITAAGVSSGIDMGLVLVQQLAGDETAKAIQLAIEYDPQPPFDSGSPSKATPELVALVSEIFSQTT